MTSKGEVVAYWSTNIFRRIESFFARQCHSFKSETCREFFFSLIATSTNALEWGKSFFQSVSSKKVLVESYSTNLAFDVLCVTYKKCQFRFIEVMLFFTSALISCVISNGKMREMRETRITTISHKIYNEGRF